MTEKKNENNEPVDIKAERSKVLKRASKFVYPVGSSRRNITLISTFVFVLFFIIFAGLFAFLVYVKNDNSNFTYQISKIIPAPIGKVGDNFVTYEEYLFELKDDLHFLTEQESIDQTSSEGKKRINELRKQAEQRAYSTALAENIAKKESIKISDQEVEQKISILKTQASDLGGTSSTPDKPIEINSGDKRFNEILKEYYNWDTTDLKRALRTQIIKSKLPAIIDENAKQEAETLQKTVSAEPKTFSEVAKQKSKDKESAEKGGDLGFLTPESSVAYPKNFLEAANKLKDGQVSAVIQTDFGLHIIKRTETNKDGQPKISHILIEYGDIEKLLGAKLMAKDVQVSKYLELNK
jgi:parvulin-like peptidyl-prolyl isomerase